MSKQLSFSSFQVLPVKVRKYIISKRLSEAWGYSISGQGKQFDKAYTKALTQFQQKCGLVGNGVVCEKTFTALGPIDDTVKSR